MGKGLVALLGTLAVAACDQLPASQDAPVAAVAEAPASAAPLTGPAALMSSAPSPTYRTQQPVLMPEPAKAEKPRQVGIHTPPPGSLDRVGLMNALRDAVRGELGTEPVFVVRDLRSDGQWAFGVVEPTLPGGGNIRPETTPLYRQGDADSLDGLRTEAIWRKENGRWSVYAHNIGATDVWFVAYCGRIPRGLMPGC